MLTVSCLIALVTAPRNIGLGSVVRRAAAVGLILGASTHAGTAMDPATAERITRQALDRQLGTLSVAARPILADGRLSGCTVAFKALARDWVYRQGGYIRVGGSFGLREANRAIEAALKVVLHDFDPRTMELTPSRPATAKFVAGDLSTSAVSHPADAGSISVALQLFPTLHVILDGLKNEKLTIAFTRAKGGADLQVAIDPTVEDTAPDGERKRSPKAGQGFANCAGQLIKGVR
jgi:hypothetical protein